MFGSLKLNLQLVWETDNGVQTSIHIKAAVKERNRMEIDR